MIAEIVSLKSRKTASVVVKRSFRHSRFFKTVKRQRKFSCHFEEGLDLKVGQKVEVKEMAPRSTSKRWLIVKAYD